MTDERRGTKDETKTKNRNRQKIGTKASRHRGTKVKRQDDRRETKQRQRQRIETDKR